MSTQYVIMKSCSAYTGGPGYAGIACEAAGVEPGKVYATKADAEADARKLSVANPIGFVVVEYKKMEKVA
jgi:hypothetical protein